MSIVPISYLARRVLRKHCAPEDAADEIVTVCPAERTIRPKAYYQPDQLERVRSVQARGGLEEQLARISETPVTHMATRAFLYRDARLLGGTLFAGKSRRQLTMKRPPRLPRAVRTSMDKVSLVGMPISDMYFAHYVVDDSATTLLAQDFGPVRSLESDYRASWNHAAPYRRLMNLEVPTLPDAFLSEAWVFQDFGMNSNRRGRIQQVRQRLANLPADRSGHAVFIVRSNSGQSLRLLENEAELADLLYKRGFTIVDPTKEAAEDIIRKISGAALVISVEGSALTHGYLTMQEHGAIITIQPPYRFENIWKDFTDLLDMKYGFVVAEGGRDKFWIDPDDVFRTIDLITG